MSKKIHLGKRKNCSQIWWGQVKSKSAKTKMNKVLQGGEKEVKGRACYNHSVYCKHRVFSAGL